MSSIFEDEETKEMFIGSMIGTDDEESIEEQLEEIEENIDYLNIGDLNRRKAKELINELKQETDSTEKQKLFIELQNIISKDGK